MITQLKEIPYRETATIYGSVLEQVRKIWTHDEELAKEFAVSVLEQVLTGEISSDNYLIEVMLEQVKVSCEKSQRKYDDKVEQTRLKRITELDLEAIAEMYLDNQPQTIIADTLGESPQTISYRLNVIRRDYPELLKTPDNKKNQTESKKLKISNTDTDTETDSDTYTDSVSDTYTYTEKDTYTDSETVSDKLPSFTFVKSGNGNAFTKVKPLLANQELPKVYLGNGKALDYSREYLTNAFINQIAGNIAQNIPALTYAYQSKHIDKQYLFMLSDAVEYDQIYLVSEIYN